MYVLEFFMSITFYRSVICKKVVSLCKNCKTINYM